MHDEARADGSGHLIAELDHLAKLVGGIDVEKRERDRSRVERLLRKPEHDRRVLPDRVQHHRPLEFRRHLPQDVDALGLEGAEVIQAGETSTTVSGKVNIGIKKKPGNMSRAFDLLRVVGELFDDHHPKHLDRKRGDPEVLIQQQAQAAQMGNTIERL